MNEKPGNQPEGYTSFGATVQEIVSAILEPERIRRKDRRRIKAAVESFLVTIQRTGGSDPYADLTDLLAEGRTVEQKDAKEILSVLSLKLPTKATWCSTSKTESKIDKNMDRLESGGKRRSHITYDIEVIFGIKGLDATFKRAEPHIKRFLHEVFVK